MDRALYLKEPDEITFQSGDEWRLHDSLCRILIGDIQKVHCLKQSKSALGHYHQTKMLSAFSLIFPAFFSPSLPPNTGLC